MWVDSGFSFSQAWTDHHDALARAAEWDGYVTTVGYLMYEDTRCVVIAQSRDGGEGSSPGEPKWASLMLINRQNVLKMEALIPMSGSTGAELPASADATSEEPVPPATPGAPRSEHCECPDHMGDACFCNQHDHDSTAYWGR